MSLRIVRRSVTTPSGEQWQVGRRWLPRPLPHWRRIRLGSFSAEDAVLSMPDVASLEDLPVALLAGVAAIVVLVVLIPLLLFGIELILVGLALAVGIIVRGLLGRPWVVQARRRDRGADALSWRVVGLARSGRVIDEVALALQSGSSPSPAELTEAIAQGPDPARRSPGG